MPITALELDSALKTSTVYSNNVRGSSMAKREDVRQTVGFDAELTETRQHMEANASINVSHERYLNDTYSGETALVGGLGVVNFDIIEYALTWESTFIRSLVLDDPTESDNPENRGFRDVLRSGPTLKLRLSDTSALTLNSRYVSVANSDEDVSDSERGEASARLSYQYNRITQFNLNSSLERILDADELDKYRKRNVNVGVSRQFAGGTGSFNIGRTRLEPEFGKVTDGNFFDVRFTRENVFWHELVFSYSEDVSDATLGNFESYSIQPELATDGSNELMTQKFFTASASRSFDSNTYVLTASQNRSFYESVPGGQEAFSAAARYTRALADNWDLGGAFSFVERQGFDDTEQGIDRDKIYTVDTHYAFSEQLGMGSFVKFIARSNSEMQERQNEEFQLGVDLHYQLQ